MVQAYKDTQTQEEN